MNTDLPEETYMHDATQCPYCGRIDRDAYELGHGGEGCGETTCGSCEKDFLWQRTVSVSYTCKPVALKEGESC